MPLRYAVSSRGDTLGDIREVHRHPWVGDTPASTQISGAGRVDDDILLLLTRLVGSYGEAERL
jgi:hypothetical protein